MRMEEAKRIRLLAMDVDGVLTDGRIILGDKDLELKCFDVRDGMGLSLARKAGLKTALLTGRRSEAVSRRAGELHCAYCLQNVADKLAALGEILRDERLAWEEVAYIGDDLNDLRPMASVGLAIAVGDAAPEVAAAAAYRCQALGGRGAVREAVEFILKTQGKWDGIVASMREGAEKLGQ